jgi:3-hydroxybutyryl-CoA dehydrogenase
MKVIIAGELPYLDELGRLCVDCGHDTTLFLVEDFLTALESSRAIEDINDADIVIEIHNESLATKQEVLLALDNASPEETLFLTSALPCSATQAASWVLNSSRVVGFGLLPPIEANGMVELAQAMQTSEDSFAQAALFWEGLGYKSVVVSDGPGLVRARLVCCVINEAVTALSEGVASERDIDKAMKLGTNYPYGPLEWADIIGLDTVLGVMEGLFSEWGDDRYRPSPLLRRMVQAGRLGQKVGEGFYAYD